jgi:hypothetical protein
MSPMETTTGFRAFAYSTSATTSWAAAGVPPGLFTRSTMASTRGLSAALLISPPTNSLPAASGEEKSPVERVPSR